MCNPWKNSKRWAKILAKGAERGEDGLVKLIWAAVTTLGLGECFLETLVKSHAQGLAQFPGHRDASLQQQPFPEKGRGGTSVVGTAVLATASPGFPQVRPFLRVILDKVEGS